MVSKQCMHPSIQWKRGILFSVCLVLYRNFLQMPVSELLAGEARFSLLPCSVTRRCWPLGASLAADFQKILSMLGTEVDQKVVRRHRYLLSSSSDANASHTAAAAPVRHHFLLVLNPSWIQLLSLTLDAINFLASLQRRGHTLLFWQALLCSCCLTVLHWASQQFHHTYNLFLLLASLI